jgi:hypothetical protein
MSMKDEENKNFRNFPPDLDICMKFWLASVLSCLFRKVKSFIINFIFIYACQGERLSITFEDLSLSVLVHKHTDAI